MMATGTAISGMIADRQFCRNSSTTTATRMMASRSVLKTSLIDSRVYGVVSKPMSYSRSSGKLLLQLVHLRHDAVGDVQGVGVGQSERSAGTTRRLAVEADC